MWFYVLSNQKILKGIYCTCSSAKCLIKQFKLDQKSKQLALRAYCSNIYKYCGCRQQSKLRWLPSGSCFSTFHIMYWLFRQSCTRLKNFTPPSMSNTIYCGHRQQSTLRRLPSVLCLRWLAGPYLDFSGTLFFNDFHQSRITIRRFLTDMLK